MSEPLEVSSDRVRLTVSPLGAAVRSLVVLGRGAPGREVVLGYPDDASYLADTCFLGAVVGRYANRIAHGRFALEGRAYVVPTGTEPHALHGGPGGFHRQEWTVASHGPDAAGRPHVGFTLTSPAGDMGFPGTLVATATYTIDDDSVVLELSATTDAPTVVNLTSHAYFNLSGALADVRDHTVAVAASHYVPVDDTLIPLGPLAPVDGTDFDLRTAGPVRRARDGVFDHCYVLDDPSLDTVATRVSSPDGWALEVSTDAPGVQLYTGEFLSDTPPGRHGEPYRPHQGLCLETQWFPDSPNQPAFPSTVLRPGEQWRTTTRWRFSTPES